MRYFLLLTTTILVTITLLPSPTVPTQQPAIDQFPKPKDPEKEHEIDVLNSSYFVSFRESFRKRDISDRI